MSYGEELNKKAIQDQLMRQALKVDTQKVVQDAASNAKNVVPQVIAGIGAGLAFLLHFLGD